MIWSYESSLCLSALLVIQHLVHSEVEHLDITVIIPSQKTTLLIVVWVAKSNTPAIPVFHMGVKGEKYETWEWRENPLHRPGRNFNGGRRELKFLKAWLTMRTIMNGQADTLCLMDQQVQMLQPGHLVVAHPTLAHNHHAHRSLSLVHHIP